MTNNLLSLFVKKKENVKVSSHEEKKSELIIAIILKYRKEGYTSQQIRRILIRKGYADEYVDNILHSVKKEVIRMAKKKEEVKEELEEEDEEEEAEDEDEEEEEFDEEELDNAPAPVIAQPVKISTRTSLPIKTNTNIAKPVNKPQVQAQVSEEDEWKLNVEQAISNLNARLTSLEANNYRRGLI